MRYCTKCGAELQTQTKFCTKCGAAAANAASAAENASDLPKLNAPVESVSQPAGSASQVPATLAANQSAKGIPKVLIAGLALVAVFVLVLGGGLMYAVHRARQKAAQKEAVYELEKHFADLAAKGNAPARNGGNSPSSTDVTNGLDQIAAAANTLAQNAQKQGGTDPLKAIQGMVGASSGSAPASSAVSAATAPNPAADPAARIAAASARADAALNPPAPPAAAPIEPEAATGNQAHDWALEYERTLGGPEADLVVRTGDINNLGFGWPPEFDPFSGQSTPSHQWPDINKIPPNAPPGTDRIMLGTSVTPVHMVLRKTAGQSDQIMLESVTHTDGGDGYSGALGDCYYIRDNALQQMPNVLHDAVARELTEKFVLSNLPDGIRELAPSSLQNQLAGFFKVDPRLAANCTLERALTLPTPIVLPVGSFRFELHTIVVQIFVDDFQPRALHSHFQVSLNGTRIPSFEYAINSLDQSGPIGKLLTLRLLPEYWPLVESGTVKLLIDDPTTRVQDGYAVDFVRILINPYKFKYQVSLAARVIDADKHTPIAGATVNAALATASTDKEGNCQFSGIPAGLVIATASAPGYDADSTPVDLVAGQTGSAEIQLHRHQETTAALEQAIAQTGTATIYGIHFDTDSSKIRGDSIPALNAVLGLIHNHPGSRWVIAGHTDNQGNAEHNQTLSEARSKSVIAWLKQHGGDVSNLVPQGFGATRPVADNATANGRALNRRVEVALAK
jgi:OmpA-OmpF porin, OOP family